MLALLWAGSLLPSDDVVFAVMVREMLAGANPLDLVVQGVVSHQRPPLAVWLMAGSAWALGETELALRLPAALAAAATLVLTASLGARLFGRVAGLCAAATLAASTLFYYTGRRVLTDPVMLALCAAAGVAYLRAQLRPRFWLLAGALLGLALMVKQIVPLVICAPWGAHFLLSGRWRRESCGGPAQAALAAVLVLAPWHLVQTLRWGGTFWSEYLGRHVLERAASSFFVKPDPWYYVRELWRQDGIMLPAYALGLVAAGVALVRRRQDRGRYGLLLLWVGVCWLPFQVSATKVAHYVLPALLPLALAVGAAVAWATRRLSIRGHWAALLIAVVALSRNAPHMASPDYGPDEKRFGLLVRAQPRSGTLLTAVDAYAQSAFWYANHPLDFTVTQDRAAAVMQRTLVLASAEAVRRQSLVELVQRLDGRTGYLVHRRESTERLVRGLRSSGRVRLRLTEGTYLNLLEVQRAEVPGRARPPGSTPAGAGTKREPAGAGRAGAPHGVAGPQPPSAAGGPSSADHRPTAGAADDRRSTEEENHDGLAAGDAPDGSRP